MTSIKCMSLARLMKRKKESKMPISGIREVTLPQILQVLKEKFKHYKLLQQMNFTIQIKETHFKKRFKLPKINSKEKANN